MPLPATAPELAGARALLHPACCAMALSAATARGSPPANGTLVAEPELPLSVHTYFVRNAIGSAFALNASSSMNDSLAKQFDMPPRLRSAEERGSVFTNGEAAAPLLVVMKGCTWLALSFIAGK